jgi:ABC-type antimicrobial peptide transport system permease subunit
VLQVSGKGIGKQTSNNTRSLLLIIQASIVTFLLCFSSLFLQKALVELQRTKGYETNDRAVLSLATQENEPTQGEIAQAIPNLISSLKKLPQIKTISVSNADPIAMTGVIFPVKSQPTAQEHYISIAKVQPNFFNVMGVDFIAGMTFSTQKIAGDNQVIINQSAAELFWGDNWRLNTTLFIANQPYTVVGVIEETYRSPNIRSQAGTELIITPYYHFADAHFPSEEYTLNIWLTPGRLLFEQQLIDVLAPYQHLFTLKRYNLLERLLAKETYIATLAASLAIAFCLLTLLLAAVGVWGIVIYSAKMRRFEFGVRMALGAKENHLIKLMLIENSKPLLLGILIGTFSSTVVISIFKKYLLVFGQLDWIHISFMILAMFTTALLAIYQPIVKMIEQAPMQALRIEN